eukprot:TRINITY_DN1799_c0_g1_i3.p1 TRINITY_DN1799_c0_g1~~TRINITY_DN1799_c0_g1_i3.p1  ORF type:complete len:834 (-),score=202.35 TRINITY_DN1799_c0_g1_i3:72-2573(-)
MSDSNDALMALLAQSMSNAKKITHNSKQKPECVAAKRVSGTATATVHKSTAVVKKKPPAAATGHAGALHHAPAQGEAVKKKLVAAAGTAAAGVSHAQAKATPAHTAMTHTTVKVAHSSTVHVTEVHAVGIATVGAVKKKPAASKAGSTAHATPETTPTPHAPATKPKVPITKPAGTAEHATTVTTKPAEAKNLAAAAAGSQGEPETPKAKLSAEDTIITKPLPVAHAARASSSPSSRPKLVKKPASAPKTKSAAVAATVTSPASVAKKPAVKPAATTAIKSAVGAAPKAGHKLVAKPHPAQVPASEGVVAKPKAVVHHTTAAKPATHSAGGVVHHAVTDAKPAVKPATKPLEQKVGAVKVPSSPETHATAATPAHKPAPRAGAHTAVTTTVVPVAAAKPAATASSKVATSASAKPKSVVKRVVKKLVQKPEEEIMSEPKEAATPEPKEAATPAVPSLEELHPAPLVVEEVKMPQVDSALLKELALTSARIDELLIQNADLAAVLEKNNLEITERRKARVDVLQEEASALAKQVEEQTDLQDRLRTEHQSLDEQLKLDQEETATTVDTSVEARALTEANDASLAEIKRASHEARRKWSKKEKKLNKKYGDTVGDADEDEEDTKKQEEIQKLQSEIDKLAARQSAKRNELKEEIARRKSAKAAVQTAEQQLGESDHRTPRDNKIESDSTEGSSHSSRSHHRHRTPRKQGDTEEVNPPGEEPEAARTTNPEAAQVAEDCSPEKNEEEQVTPATEANKEEAPSLMPQGPVTVAAIKLLRQNSAHNINNMQLQIMRTLIKNRSNSERFRREEPSPYGETYSGVARKRGKGSVPCARPY